MMTVTAWRNKGGRGTGEGGEEETTRAVDINERVIVPKIKGKRPDEAPHIAKN